MLALISSASLIRENNYMSPNEMISDQMKDAALQVAAYFVWPQGEIVISVVAPQQGHWFASCSRFKAFACSSNVCVCVFSRHYCFH